HHPHRRDRSLRLRRRGGRAYDRRQAYPFRRRGDRRPLVASAGRREIPQAGECRMSAEQKLAELGLTLPPVPKPIGNYVPFKRAGDLIFLSGQGPRRAEGGPIAGKVGKDVTVEEAYEYAKLIGLGLLAVAKLAAGDLDKVEVLKVLGMVN